MVEIIIKDISDTLVHLKSGVLIASVLIGMIFFVQSKSAGKWSWHHFANWFLFFTYAVVLIKITLLSREPGSRTAADLMPFSTWGNTMQSRAYVIENVIMLLPMGLLLPGLHRIFRKGWIACLCFAAISLGLESVQYVTQRGYLQTDDMIMNTVGGFCGYVLWKLLFWITKLVNRPLKYS